MNKYIALIGSKTFKDYKTLKELVEAVLNKYFIEEPHFVSGGEKGADTLGHNFAKNEGYPITIYYPNYSANGRAASIIRNENIVISSDIIIAFWDGESAGTKNAINIAKQHPQKVVIIYNYIEEKIKKIGVE